ncbi:MAG: hypothetical protein ACUVQ1_09015 [Candidatus Kapaibacteriales bacterium]
MTRPEKKFPIVPKKKVDEDILFKGKYEEELLHRQQMMREIRERIRQSILKDDPAFIRTLKIFLSSWEENPQNKRI